jgi:3-hydroxybutyryl-CoA dehydrogenase
MKIVIIAKTPPPVLFPAAAADCITVPSLEELGAHGDADLFIDLDFERHDSKAARDARIAALCELLPAPVIINAVIPTLAEIKRPFIRINGWPGFLDRELHELSAPDPATAQLIGKWYEKLGGSYRLAPDIPGMITARILATIINEAWYTWEAGVSTKEEIDTAMKLGTNYPYGPFEWSQQIGLARIVSLLNVLSVANARYMPANSLQQAAAELKCD